MKEFRVAQGMDKLLVVACEPVQAIRAVDPTAYPHASDGLAYLMGGGQVIFHDTDDVEAEIMKFIVLRPDVGGMEPEPEPEPAPAAAAPGQVPAAASPLPGAGIKTLADFAAAVADIDDVDDLLECTAEEISELLEENSALLGSDGKEVAAEAARGACGRRQCRCRSGESAFCAAGCRGHWGGGVWRTTVGGAELDLGGGPVIWKATVVECENVMLGAIGNARPERNSNSDPTAFGCHGYGQVIIAGQDTAHGSATADKTLQQGDVCVLKLEAEQLSMRVQRLGDRAFTVPTNGQRGLRVWVCLGGSRVRLTQVLPHEEY